MVDKIELPVIIPNRLLISPGVWNDNEYTAMEIGDGFARTDWVDKTKVSLWLNHDDKNTSAFVGYVKNPVLASQGRVFGDLEIWDEKTATILTQAMAKFGISAKIKGEEDDNGKMRNFSFENFSVVTVPACGEAYINLSKKEKEETKIVSKYLLSDKDIIEDKTNDGEASKDTDERRLENMVEEEKKEEVVEEKSEAVEEAKAPAEAEPAEKELSEKDLLKELSSKFDKLVSLLSKTLAEKEEEVEEEKVESIDEEGESLLPAKEDENSEPKEEVEVVAEAKELTAVKKELAEAKAKLNAPKSKTIRNLSSNSVGEDAKYNHDVFCELLGSADKPMKFI